MPETIYMPTGSEKSLLQEIRKSLTIWLFIYNYSSATVIIIFIINYALKLFESYTIKSTHGFRKMFLHIKLHVYNWNIIINCSEKNVLGIKN